jgi:hypothetical protein
MKSSKMTATSPVRLSPTSFISPLRNPDTNLKLDEPETNKTSATETQISFIFDISMETIKSVPVVAILEIKKEGVSQPSTLCTRTDV